MKKIIIATSMLLFSSINICNALIKVDITRGNLDPLPIAVSPLHVDPSSTNHKDVKIKQLGEDISKIIEKTYKSTG